MAEIPCATCKYKNVKTPGFVTFYSCSDSEKRKGLAIDVMSCTYRCCNYVKEQNVVTND